MFHLPQMPDSPAKHVALVLQTRMPENAGILKGVAHYERINANWRFFLDDQAMSVANPSWLFRRKWDGVICRHRFSLLLEECKARGVPCVDLEDSDYRVRGVPKIKPDNRAVGHVGAEHLLERGFGSFGYCGFIGETWSQDRRSGFVEGLEAMGRSCSVLETAYSYELTPDWDVQERDAIRKWVEGLPRPAGIMACNDMRALQVIDAVLEAGFVIPEEVAVLGANNESIRAELSHPPLSSVPMNTFEWGQQGAKALHNLFEGRPVPELSFIEPMPVVVRRSTDTLAVDDPAIVQALMIIHKEACESLRVDDLARRVSISRSLLERRFRKYLRRSPQEEIRNARIAKAKHYLIETDKKLEEIADITGFEHPEYLSVMFKRLTGETPRDYRQRHRSQ
jgi:LacI family transcriptional regulator